jgi:excinuclease ABC subunit A
MAGSNKIVVRGAREHNLKNISLTIPKYKLVCITGVSGSGKSSLAFDTIYAEGQRRYVESLSAYARQFLGQHEKPDVDGIDGLSPAISIDQKTTSKNPRSTVGTVTEIYDYLRLLFARVGHPHCPKCGHEIGAQTIEQIMDRVCLMPEKTKFLVLAPLVRHRKGEFRDLFAEVLRDGFSRVMVDGVMRHLDGGEEIKLEKYENHTIQVVVDRLMMKEGIRRRAADSIETALRLADGLVEIATLGEDGEIAEIDLYSERFSCPTCGTTLPELEPRTFSFNAPQGACTACEGLGTLREVDPDRIVSDDSLSIADGALDISGLSFKGNRYHRLVRDVARKAKIPMNVPWMDLSPDHRHVMMYGSTNTKDIFVRFKGNSRWSPTEVIPFEGLVAYLGRYNLLTDSQHRKEIIENLMSDAPCPACKGARLRPEVLAVTINGKSISDVTEFNIEEASRFFENLVLNETEAEIAQMVLKEIEERLGFLNQVGLGYLSLNRSSRSTSGGESQRLRLASQIGSQLTGVLFVLDEPSLGIGPSQVELLTKTLKNLVDIGNTVIFVEHSEDMMMESDHIIDIGPRAGVHGGEVVAQGTPKQIMTSKKSLTGQYLSGRKLIPIPERVKPDGRWVCIKGAAENNLKHIDVKIPVGLFTCVTGVSGSGKSTLINDIFYQAAAQKLHRSKVKPGKHQRIEGLEHFDKVIMVDQSPIGRTPRSNPATYVGVFDQIRQLYAKLPEAQMRGYKAGRFSFNVKAGRCEACQGNGVNVINMHFLPSIEVECPVCHGKRYNSETLAVLYNGKSIADVLAMTIEEAYHFFEKIPAINRKFKALVDVGMGYALVGQPSTQLSGGEAQRIKLAAELSKVQTGKTIFFFDEPSSGLSTANVHALTDILLRLRSQGNTIVVIEHQIEFAKVADYVLDLGPGGGDAGGTVVVCGAPEEVAKHQTSKTAPYLRDALEKARHRRAAPRA